MAMLDREALLKAASSPKNLPRDQVDVPEFGGFVIVQGMTGTERDAWEKSLVVLRRGVRRDINVENIRARLAVRCLVNEDGARLFEDEDAKALGNLRVDVLQRIYETAQRLSGVTDGDLEELKKSSETAAGSDLPTP